jgi:indolepyruvate ferredoxin oxidoreductase
MNTRGGLRPKLVSSIRANAAGRRLAPCHHAPRTDPWTGLAMNAPLPTDALKALATLSLDDKYSLPAGLAFMSGVQALVRLPMLQRTRDAQQGLRTAGFISGYRGSPLGAYDQSLSQAQAHLAKHRIVFQHGVNEELAATAVWGSQQLGLTPGPNEVDGVFGIWYGKGPGVDRSVDVFKHANMAGTSALGGVVAVAGDDHSAKSSSLAHQSDHVFKACGIPVFFPSSVQEILDLGLHAFALSRYAGVWSGLKTIQEVVESATSVDVSPDRVHIVLPDEFAMPPGGLHIRWPDTPLDQELRLLAHKLYAAMAYVRANQLNRTVLDSPDARLGLMASGKAYNDLRQALHDLGLDEVACRQLGLRIHKVAVVWPLEPHGTRAFAQGLQEILVVEEKRQMLEYQLKEELYNWREDVRPHVLGKFDEAAGDLSGGEWSVPNPADRWLLRATADLNPALIAKAVAARLQHLGLLARVDVEVRERVAERLRVIEAKEARLNLAGVGEDRPPWFCSGCPHNTSTRVPQGSRATAGIGCHYMAQWMDRGTSLVSQMGGEGVAWVGQAPFTREPHVFANLGDGTYAHSGVLAIRQAVVARVNITYKILYNDAVAMTGGQQVESGMSVAAMTHELRAEGVVDIRVLSDAPEVHRGRQAEMASGVQVHHRDELDAVQRVLREVPGVSVLIYEQTCATEKRRRRKRGALPAATTHVVINEAVCEGCGDCAVQSNCLSVAPVATSLGIKRRIDQSSCNQDLSCLQGSCPSLVSVEGGRLRKPDGLPVQVEGPELPLPALPSCDEAYGVVVAGVGGTGVITMGQLLGMAAHLEGKAVVTQDAAGLAQKGGATWSHVQIAHDARQLRTTKVSTAEADLVLACDGVVAALPATLSVMQPGRTRVALNTHATPTAHALRRPDAGGVHDACQQRLLEEVGSDNLALVDAIFLAERLMGDAIHANPLMLGFAWQRGWLPLRLGAIEEAIRLNGVQVARNLEALHWGRRAACDPAEVMRQAVPAQVVRMPVPRLGRPGVNDVDALMADRFERLLAYQDEAYANRYRQRLHTLKQAMGPGPVDTLHAAATQLYRLMACKDEYEVARLLSAPAFAASLRAQFDGPITVRWHLAPSWWPVGSPSASGRLHKLPMGPLWQWLIARLPAWRRWRGTALDPFAQSMERRLDREVLRTFEQLLDTVALAWPDMSRAGRSQVADLIEMADGIKGFGPVREPGARAALQAWRAYLSR